MPPAFHIEQADDEQLYLPLAIESNRGHGYLHVVARLRPGVRVAAGAGRHGRGSRRALAAVVSGEQADVGVNVMSMADGLARYARSGLFTMLAVVGVVLLIACANVAGLMLARGSSRQHELARSRRARRGPRRGWCGSC